MKLFLSLLMGASLSSCALMGVYGPEAQERAQQALAQMGEGVAQAGAAYAQGYSETYQAYHPYCPPAPYYHSGIITQSGNPPALYSVSPSGGMIIQPGEAPIFISGY